MSRCKWIYAFYRYLSIFIIILRLLQIYWTRWDYWSKFYLPSLQYAACEAQQFDLVAVPWLCWEIFSKNEQWTHKLWNQGGVWKVTRSNKTQKFSLSLEFRFDYNYFKPSYQFGYLISRFFFEILRRNSTKRKEPNTKNKRNIFTLRALRYEMADESVSIQGTTSQLCLFCPTTGKFRMLIQDINSVYNAQWEFVVYGLWYSNWPTTMNFFYLLKTSSSCTEIWYGEIWPLSVKTSCLVFK